MQGLERLVNQDPSSTSLWPKREEGPEEKVRLSRAAFLAKGLLWHPLVKTGAPTQVPLQKGGPGNLERA